VTVSGGLLCVHAHPDDETIATGGVLAQAAALGRPVAVVTCTGGELGEVFGEGLDPEEVGPRLPEVRLAELTRALDILGAGPPRLLGYRDSGMLGTPGNADPRSFWQAPFDEAVGRLVAHVRSLRPDVVVTYDAFGGYGHPDHIQSHRVTTVAVEAAAVPVLYPEAGPAWQVSKLYQSVIARGKIAQFVQLLAERGLPSPFDDLPAGEAPPIGVPDDLVTTVVDIRPWLAVKQAALRAHHSQLGPDSFFLNVPDDLSDGVFGEESFVRVRSLVRAPEREDDLFAGLPAAA
jgi:N-acetyl-1-D-myo-inositol-2-amino-2-deoxy-alpha-D-glucopyranoside deacetylase